MTGTSQALDLADLPAFAGHKAAELERLSFQEPLAECKLIVLADVRDNFQGSHGPDGTPWPPLAFERPQGGSKPLLNTGVLAASMAGGAGHVESISDTELLVGTNLDRASIHQDGGTIEPAKAQALAIPMTPEAARVPGPRQFPEPLFPIKRQEKPPVLAAKTGKGPKAFQVHFALAVSVTIPARPYAGFSQHGVSLIDATFADFLAAKAV